mmetsp:Transcript_6584/g.22156  ORF Transcript_6584/g.22156 Transcript_6584/m.22156 type:complete len:228 (+) Transcript_6584:449-1132(+)
MGSAASVFEKSAADSDAPSPKAKLSSNGEPEEDASCEEYVALSASLISASRVASVVASGNASSAARDEGDSSFFFVPKPAAKTAAWSFSRFSRPAVLANASSIRLPRPWKKPKSSVARCEPWSFPKRSEPTVFFPTPNPSPSAGKFPDRSRGGWDSSLFFFRSIFSDSDAASAASAAASRAPPIFTTDPDLNMSSRILKCSSKLCGSEKKVSTCSGVASVRVMPMMR